MRGLREARERHRAVPNLGDHTTMDVNFYSRPRTRKVEVPQLSPRTFLLELITVITTSLTILTFLNIISHQEASAENIAVNLDPQEVELQKAMHVRRALGYN